MNQDLLPDILKIRPASPTEIIVVLRERSSVEGEKLIFMREDADNDHQYYTVVRCGEGVDSVKPNDLIFMSWKKMTPPMKGMLNGVITQFAFADYKEIDAVIDQN